MEGSGAGVLGVMWCRLKDLGGEGVKGRALYYSGIYINTCLG